MRFPDPTPWLLFVPVALACSTPRVETTMRPDTILSSYTGIHVMPSPDGESAPRSYSAGIGAEMERRGRIASRLAG